MTMRTLHSSPDHQPTITAIEEQARDKERVNIYVDGKFAVGVFTDVVANLGLRVGQPMDTARLEEITQAETLRRAVEDAYRQLSYRARSEKEIGDKLKRKGYEPTVIETVVAKLRDAGMVDDAEFAGAWVRSRGGSRGSRALTFELRQKGVDSEAVQAALSENTSEETELQSALKAARSKVGDRPKDLSREAQARLAAFLQRRGFGWDTIRPVLRDLYTGTAADETEEEAE